MLNETGSVPEKRRQAPWTVTHGSCYGDNLCVLLFFLHKTLEDKKKKKGLKKPFSSCLDWGNSCFRPVVHQGPAKSFCSTLIGRAQCSVRGRTRGDVYMPYAQYPTSSCSPDVPEEPDILLKVHSSHLTSGMNGMR